MSQLFFWILNTMHKILPANGKITDCLSKKEVFSIASSASGSAILYALYANTSYKSGGTSLRAPCLVFLICIFSSQSLYLSANALPRSIASRPAFDCVSSHVRSCLVPRSLKGIGTVARRSVQKSLSSLCGQSELRCWRQRFWPYVRPKLAAFAFVHPLFFPAEPWSCWIAMKSSSWEMWAFLKLMGWRYLCKKYIPMYNIYRVNSLPLQYGNNKRNYLL